MSILLQISDTHFGTEQVPVVEALATLAPGRKEVVVAFDGEVARMRSPIDIRVLDKPLYLLMPQRDDSAIDTRSRTEETGG